MIYLLTFFIVAHAAQPNSKTLVSSTHGDKLSVTYSVLNNGHHVLEATNSQDPKKNQVIELNLKKSEFLSEAASFRCYAVGPKFPYHTIQAYGVIAKSLAKPEKPVHPNRAWIADVNAGQLVPVTNTKEIECNWEKMGESEFPF